MRSAVTCAVIALSIGGGCGASREANLAAEYEAFVAELCACETEACADTAHERMSAWEAGHRSRKLTTRDVATAERYVACETERVQRYVATVQDAAAYVPEPEPAPAPTPSPAPEPAPEPMFDDGPALTAVQLAQLEVMVSRLDAMEAEVTPLGCKAAAKAVTRAWQGFTPVKQVIRGINPDEDPALESWLIDNYVRRAFAAIMSSLVEKGMAGCDKVRAWNRAVKATDFMGTKGGDE